MTPLTTDQPQISKPPSPAKAESKTEEEAEVKEKVSSGSEPNLTDPDDSDDEVQKANRQKIQELKVQLKKAKQKKKKPIGVVLVKDRTVMDIKLEDKTNKWNETFLAAGKKEKPGLSMFDSGCFRCIAGLATHEDWVKLLALYGLKPIIVDRVEESVFGNCETELSDKAFMYPAFHNGKIIDVRDIARIKPECPSLISKKLVKNMESQSGLW